MTTESSSADRSFPESAEWTSASHGPDGVMPSSPRSSRSGEPSSPPGSPASPSTRTSATSPSASVSSGPASTFSPSGAPARTSASQASGEDSTATAPASSGRQCESPGMALFDPEPYSWKTWKGSCQAITDGTSPSSWTRWPSAGIGGATGFSTRNTSACPSGAAECSCSPSLTTILEPNASPRYSLSAKAAAGILRRATRRGRVLPPALEQALRAVADQVTP